MRMKLRTGWVQGIRNVWMSKPKSLTAFSLFAFEKEIAVEK